MKAKGTLIKAIDDRLTKQLSHAFNSTENTNPELLKNNRELIIHLEAGLSNVKNLEDIALEFAQAISGEAIQKVVTELIQEFSSSCEKTKMPHHYIAFPTLDDYIAFPTLDDYIAFPTLDEIDKNSEKILELLIPDKQRILYNPTCLALLQCIENSTYTRNESGFKGPTSIMHVGNLYDDNGNLKSEVYCFISGEESNIVSIAHDNNDILFDSFSISESESGLDINVIMQINTDNILIVEVEK
jgi:hypothetical protein